MSIGIEIDVEIEIGIEIEFEIFVSELELESIKNLNECEQIKKYQKKIRSLYTNKVQEVFSGNRTQHLSKFLLYSLISSTIFVNHHNKFRPCTRSDDTRRLSTQ